MSELQPTENVLVCGPKDEVPDGALELCVASFSLLGNPPEWRDLWLLSPLATITGGVAVPGLDRVRSMTMENAWQFLKIWPGEDGWQGDIAREAFRSTCAIRYPQGRGKRAVGFHWGVDGSVIDYPTARRRIYVPAYAEMLSNPERSALISRLRSEAMVRPVHVWDPDSYDVRRCGMNDLLEAIDYLPSPFAHAFVVAMAVADRLGKIMSE